MRPIASLVLRCLNICIVESVVLGRQIGASYFSLLTMNALNNESRINQEFRGFEGAFGIVFSMSRFMYFPRGDDAGQKSVLSHRVSQERSLHKCQ